ncbi:MAG: hypothetical protein C0393_03015 [Anaerolinea sp.]|nr:hypothetical protein [Anaerolinea sp.]
MKKLTQSTILIALSIVLAASLSAAAVPAPNITLVNGLPSEMQVGESYTVVVEVDSNQPFISAMTLPDLQYPGKGVVAKGGDHATRGMTATLEVTFIAKSSTAQMPGGVDPLAVVVGVRYANGYVFSERFDFAVAVP